MKKRIFILILLSFVWLMAACRETNKPGNIPDYSISLSNLSIEQGKTKIVTVAINKINGFSEQVELNLDVLPTGVTATLSPKQTIGESKLTINVDAAVKPATHKLKLFGKALTSGTEHSTEFELQVVEVVVNKTFELSAQSVTVTKPRDKDLTIKIPVTINRINGFGDAINLGLALIPAGLTFPGFNPNPAGQSSELVLLAKAKGSYPLTITGSAGGQNKTVDITVVVNEIVDTVAPNIVSVSPNNKAKGVRSDAKIYIHFSEPMDRATTEAAFMAPSWADNTPIQVLRFSWEDNDKTLVVKPKNLDYSGGDKAIGYNYMIDDTATDKAGNKLAGGVNKMFTFTTYRTLDKVILSTASLVGTVQKDNNLYVLRGDLTVGDNPNNDSFRAFVSFNLNVLPDDMLRIESAYVRLQKKKGPVGTGLGQLYMESVDYGKTLDASNGNDFNTAAFHKSEVYRIYRNYYYFEDLGDWIQEDWDNRATRGKRSQMRLAFTKLTDNDSAWDYILFEHGDKTWLVVKYLAP